MRLAHRAIVVASLACLAMGGACREPRPLASTGSQTPVTRAAPEDSRFTSRRQAMVDRQLRARGIQNGAVLAAMAKVPRHRFVPDSTVDLAYADSPLPIGYGQTISQPYIVAYMSEALEISPARQGARDRHRIRLPGGDPGRAGP